MNPIQGTYTDAKRTHFGEHLRHWRQHRRLSQLELSAQADISTRHLSFVETGRSLPSREVVLRLSLHPNGPAPRILNLGQTGRASRRERVSMLV